jgi:hypothetical protein
MLTDIVHRWWCPTDCSRGCINVQRWQSRTKWARELGQQLSKTHKVPWIVLKLGNVDVTGVDGAADQSLLVPSFALTDFDHLSID